MNEGLGHLLERIEDLYRRQSVYDDSSWTRHHGTKLAPGAECQGAL